MGLGAGWYEPEYEAIEMPMPRPGVRIDRLAEAIEVVTGLLAGAPFTVRGHAPPRRRARAAFRARSNNRTLVCFVGGKGDRLLRLVAERADGWNTCWTWTPEAYRERVDVLGSCVRAGRS